VSASAGGGGCQCVSPPQRHRASRVEIGMSSSSFGRQCIHVLESVHAPGIEVVCQQSCTGWLKLWSQSERLYVLSLPTSAVHQHIIMAVLVRRARAADQN